jgi:oligopeptide/dipeptide ABC transporter ATP-binding protein
MGDLIRVEHLKTYFDVPAGTVHAVDDVTFTIKEGHTMGVVGESGCGKTTLGRTIIHLQESTDGKIFYRDRDVTKLDKKGLKQIREEMQIVFQDPFSSLNPRMTVEESVMEPLKLSKKYAKNELQHVLDNLLEQVGIDERLRASYPHELDGGRRQRVVIARALAMNPSFICCDEPVSALDVSIQAQVLNLLQDLQEQRNLTYLFITHDLSVVRHISDDICVMYLGQLVETSPSKKLFVKPLHPYTKALLSAIPSPDLDDNRQRILLEGELTSPINPKPGCRFAPRCKYACERCHQPQQLEELEPNHFVSCCRARELND